MTNTDQALATYKRAQEDFAFYLTRHHTAQVPTKPWHYDRLQADAYTAEFSSASGHHTVTIHLYALRAEVRSTNADGTLFAAATFLRFNVALDSVLTYVASLLER